MLRRIFLSFRSPRWQKVTSSTSFCTWATMSSNKRPLESNENPQTTDEHIPDSKRRKTNPNLPVSSPSQGKEDEKTEEAIIEPSYQIEWVRAFDDNFMYLLIDKATSKCKAIDPAR